MTRTSRPLHVAAALLATIALTAACGGGDKKKAATKATTTTVTPTTAVATPAGAPLTGVGGGDAARLGRPALIVKIDNAPNGRPQAGLNQADVVFEEGVEGGITRFAVVFHSQDADEVGPVRSARTTDILIASALNKPLFAWSGSNADFVKLVRAAPLTDVGVDVKGGAYTRKSGRPNPYNLFASMAKLYEGTQGSAPPALFTYRADGEASAGDPTGGVHLQWKDKVQTLVDWKWDAAGGAWTRTENGTPHVDAAGTQVTAKNVLVQFTTYHDTGYRDRSNTLVPEADLVGEGDAWLLADGKVVKGRWKKADANAVTTFVDGAGAPLKLTPGQTWVELPKPGDGKLL
ncbi:MAG TPA: DUF3048 domain-containing protein [Acidimicrobiales bacterium]|nr:DUF3048 domain-containing protein [Acidimicrobiales bacterium]